MLEEDAIRFAILHLEGAPHEWWYRGLITLGHNLITTYDEFTKKLIERFDVKDPEVSFHELAQLKQNVSLESYVADFQQLSVMVPNISERRLVSLFIEGLMEPLKGWLKAFDPPSLQGKMKKARGMEFAAPTNNFPSKGLSSYRDNKKFQKKDDKAKGATHNFIDARLLERRNICTKDFEGIRVKVVDGYTLKCEKMIPNLPIPLNTFKFKADFYVVNMKDIDMVLKMTWLHDIGIFTLNLQEMEMRFERDVDNDIQDLRIKHDKVFNDIPPARPPNRGIENIIELEEGTNPMIVTPYRHPKRLKDKIEKTIKELLGMGNIRPSKSPFASSIVLVKKKDVCGYAIWANQRTYHFPVHDELGISFTAVEIFASLLDDILVYNKTWKEHIAHLDTILGILGKESLYAKESKCDLGMTELPYLGHVISAEGVHMDPNKVKAIVDWPTPVNLTQLRGFLGLCGFYRRFANGYS
ncbi:uncharacterized protein LOC131859077 [Cryptomeria japonica]|uniref:uncharacterized protein LOC131859077 n=1 Tax=Cryptomeria japonica TaxID=3369 RepID=UPI0027DA51B0|nr:uncharacterized protein LOC131859077 [Cryptomeria japonica]